MKVALVNNAWRGTGVGRYVFELFNEYTRLKKKISMLYINNKFPFGLDDKKIKDIYSPIKNALISNFFIYPYKIPKGYDIYHVSNETIAKCCNKRNSVLTIAALLPFIQNRDNLLKRTLEKIQLSNATRAEKIITFSEATKNHICQELKLENKKVEVVYPGVNHSLFRLRSKIKIREKYGLPKDKKIILHVGTEEPRKNVGTILSALPRIIKEVPDVLFIRVGWQSLACKDIIEKYHLKDNVKYMDINTKYVHEIYNAADVFVFPSYYEGFNFTLAEAISSGLPVVASDIPVNYEVVGRSSLFCGPFDIEGFERNIVKVLSDYKLAYRLSKVGIRRSSIFTWERAAGQTWKIYENLC